MANDRNFSISRQHRIFGARFLAWGIAEHHHRDGVTTVFDGFYVTFVLLVVVESSRSIGWIICVPLPKVSPLFRISDANALEIEGMNGPDFSRMELIPVIAQDIETGDVLMLAYMNQEAYSETIRTGRVCYFSRSRQKLWRKGEESGNVQELREVYFDCDADTLLVKVNQVGGAACHEGYRSCFFRRIDPANGSVEVVGDRVFDPKDVYKKT